MTTHVYRDEYGDELEITAYPKGGQVKLFSDDPTKPGEPEVIIHTRRPVNLSMVATKHEMRAQFNRGWFSGMATAAAIVLVVLGILLAINGLS